MTDEQRELVPAVVAFLIPIILIVLFIFIMMFRGCGLAHAQMPEKESHARHIIEKGAFVNAIIGEAENSPEGMLWVACTIRNRGSLRGVYGGKSVRVRNRLYSSRTFVQAVEAYEESARQDVTGGCRYWFSDSDLKMSKVQRIIKLEHLRLVRRIGGNNFYRKG